MGRNTKKTVAVDFDGTLFTDMYPEIGKPVWKVIDYVKKLKSKGYCLVLWTCRVGEDLEEAVNMSKEVGIEFDFINQNPPDLVKMFGSDPRKISADIYIDDRSISPNDIMDNEKERLRKENERLKKKIEELSCVKASSEIEDLILWAFDYIWAIYPVKKGKQQAKTTFEHKFRGMSEEDIKTKANEIYRVLKAHILDWQIKKTQDCYIPHFSTWLNQEIPNSKKYKGGKA